MHQTAILDNAIETPQFLRLKFPPNPHEPMTTPPFRRHVSCKYGAPMGRPATKPEPDSPPCRLRRVHLRQGYDDGGAYWGEPDTLWCLYTDCGSVEVYTRADNRPAAIQKLKTLYPFLKLQRR